MAEIVSRDGLALSSVMTPMFFLEFWGDYFPNSPNKMDSRTVKASPCTKKMGELQLRIPLPDLHIWGKIIMNADMGKIWWHEFRTPTGMAKGEVWGMLKKSFSISEEQGEYLLSTANYVKSRGGRLSESGIVRVALELLMGFPIDIRAAKDEDALRRGSLRLMELAKDTFKTLKMQLSELDYLEGLKDKMADAVYMVDEKGNFTLVNRVAQKRMGYTREELIGEHFSKIVAPEYRDMLNEYLERRMSGQEGPEKYRVEVIAKNKERFQVELNITPIEDEEGAMVAVFGTAKEISSGQV